MWRGRSPASKHVLYWDGDLELAGVPRRSARHLRRSLSWLRFHGGAEVSQMQTLAARVGRVATVRGRPQTSVTIRHRPSGSKNMMRITWRRGRQTRSAVPATGGSGKDGQLGLSYLARILDRVGRAKRRSSPRTKQGTAEAAARGARAVARPSEGDFQDARRPGAGPDRAHPDCSAEGRSHTCEAGRPGRQSGHWVAGDRRPAGCDQTGGPTALPAPPSWQPDCSRSTQLTSRKSGQCQGSGDT